MKRLIRLSGGVIVTALAIFLAGSPSPALAASGSVPLGQMVAMCAQMDLGARGNPPAVSCTCDGTTLTFANFGKMVQHMKDTGCSMSCC